MLIKQGSIGKEAFWAALGNMAINAGKGLFSTGKGLFTAGKQMAKNPMRSINVGGIGLSIGAQGVVDRAAFDAVTSTPYRYF